MPLWLKTTQADFADRFEALLGQKRELSQEVGSVVAGIVEDVRTRGDEALFDLTLRFDRLDLSKAGLRVSGEEIDEAAGTIDAKTSDALDLAAKRIFDYHARQRPEDDLYTDEAGVTLGHQWKPVASAGLYVPGGTASYPSSVLMNAIPAKVAGVDRIVMCVPCPDGDLNPLVLAAAKKAGVSEVYRIGGAQAVAAMAYGTATIAPVDVIVGPGNAYVAAAKAQVYGTVGIDMIAGPSEILVFADSENNPDWIAADLLSQAEHDPSSQSILITNDDAFAQSVEAAIERQLSTLPRAEIAGASWQNFGTVILVRDQQEALPLIDALAPEHLELAIPEPLAMARQVRNAGAIFLGHYTPEAVGDYVAGTNHVLPTARAARYASGLGVLDFMKRSSLVGCTAEALGTIGPAAEQLAKLEGLDAHGRSISLRLNRKAEDV